MNATFEQTAENGQGSHLEDSSKICPKCGSNNVSQYTAVTEDGPGAEMLDCYSCNNATPMAEAANQ